jgi:hypothetical protein
MNLMAKKTNFQPVVESRIQSRNFRPTAGTLAEQTQGQNMSMEKNGPMTVEVEKNCAAHERGRRFNNFSAELNNKMMPWHVERRMSSGGF